VRFEQALRRAASVRRKAAAKPLAARDFFAFPRDRTGSPGAVKVFLSKDI
jgi:hypothetical protein